MLQEEDEKKKKMKKMIDLRIAFKTLSVNLLRIRDNQLGTVRWLIFGTTETNRHDISSIDHI